MNSAAQLVYTAITESTFWPLADGIVKPSFAIKFHQSVQQWHKFYTITCIQYDNQPALTAAAAGIVTCCPLWAATTEFLGRIAYRPIGISTGSAVFAGLTNMTKRFRPRYSVCSNKPRLVHWVHTMLLNNDNDITSIHVNLRGLTYIHTCQSCIHTPRDFTNGASLA